MGVTFDDGQSSAPSASAVANEQPKGLTGFFIRLGIASTPAGAQIAMIVLSCVMIGASVFLYIVSRPKPPIVSEDDREELLLDLRRGADGRTRLQ